MRKVFKKRAMAPGENLAPEAPWCAIRLSKYWLGRAIWGLTVRRRALPCPCLAPAYEHPLDMRLCQRAWSLR